MSTFRPSTPRIPPLPPEQWDDLQRELLGRIVQGPTVNIYATVARHPELLDRMTALGRALRGQGLPVRDREILILRTGWRCQSEYEFAQHRRLAMAADMTEEDIRRIIEGPDAAGWDPFELVLCQAADEVHDDGCISDATWARLAKVYDEQQLIQATMLIGYYHLVSFVLNSLGVPLEAGAVGFPAG
jgi:alkylhydroperoxidase family enzyme